MRTLIINRILHILLCNGGTTPRPPMNLKSNRFECVFELHWEMVHGEDSSLPKRKDRKSEFSSADLELLTDSELIKMFELVVRRANTCM